ncbi:MAG: CCA tRNA nucleotidyltransferase [Chloroflexi bacterium]|nr:CCA tRNA nucleotidyltransferase [Chloroflexota bacterium]
MTTPENDNLSGRLDAQLPPDIVSLLRDAGAAAEAGGQRLYLVGGVVRDLLLGKGTRDLDLVVEGDALEVAGRLASTPGVRLVARSQFGTAKLCRANWVIDIATARSEVYPRPGALPSVSPGDIRSDLFRRDFTINAMAVSLSPGDHGRLLDFYGGRRDLAAGLVRVLHERSFADDATRIWRVVRYEQRLGFTIEPATLALLHRDIAMLDAISGARIRHELELALEEPRPERVLARAGELGALFRINPALEGDGRLAGRYERARELSRPAAPSPWLYLALLGYDLAADDIGALTDYLHLPKAAAAALRETVGLKSRLEELADPGIRQSAVYSLLCGYGHIAVTANLIASDNPVVRGHLETYLNRLRFVRTHLDGEFIKGLGVTGPRIREVLRQVHAARLDGEVATRREEEELARRLAGF